MSHPCSSVLVVISFRKAGAQQAVYLIRSFLVSRGTAKYNVAGEVCGGDLLSTRSYYTRARRLLPEKQKVPHRGGGGNQRCRFAVLLQLATSGGWVLLVYTSYVRNKVPCFVAVSRSSRPLFFRFFMHSFFGASSIYITPTCTILGTAPLPAGVRLWCAGRGTRLVPDGASTISSLLAYPAWISALLSVAALLCCYTNPARLAVCATC